MRELGRRAERHGLDEAGDDSRTVLPHSASCLDVAGCRDRQSWPRTGLGTASNVGVRARRHSRVGAPARVPTLSPMPSRDGVIGPCYYAGMPGNGVAAGASYGDLLVTSLLVLGAVCIAAYVAVALFRCLLSAGRARGTHLLDGVARVPLEPRRSLYVVEVAGKTLLVGTSEMGLSVLSELDSTEVKSRVPSQQ